MIRLTFANPGRHRMGFGIVLSDFIVVVLLLPCQYQFSVFSYCSGGSNDFKSIMLFLVYPCFLF